MPLPPHAGTSLEQVTGGAPERELRLPMNVRHVERLDVSELATSPPVMPHVSVDGMHVPHPPSPVVASELAVASPVEDPSDVDASVAAASEPVLVDVPLSVAEPSAAIVPESPDASLAEPSAAIVAESPDASPVEVVVVRFEDEQPATSARTGTTTQESLWKQAYILHV